MNHRRFNSLMPHLNEEWAAEILGMEINPVNGADLIDDKKIVEVKFKVRYPKDYTHFCWRVLDYQKDYRERETRYWALGTYELPIKASKLGFKNLGQLEMQVGKRRLWIVEWAWMNQFPFYREQGRRKTIWNNRIAFPKGRLLPEIEEEYQVRKGIVYLTKGVKKNDFNGIKTR